jgi:hypothetical protein
MAWKKIGTYRIDPGMEPLKVGPDFGGGSVRVTVEEEVSECCEKWRVGTTRVQWSNGCNDVTYIVNPKFCPECGKKL